MSDHTEPNTNGTDYVSDSEFDSLIAELQSITEEARATDYHDTLRKAALFLNLHRAKVIQYANDIVRLDAACTEQHDAYVSACNRVDEINDLDYAKAQVRSAGYSLVSAEFISNFAEFIQDWRKGDFALPKLAALDVEACFDAWQKEVNQNEVKPVLQALERVPMTTAAMVNVIKAAGWSADVTDRQLIAAFNLIEATEAHHNITPPESI